MTDSFFVLGVAFFPRKWCHFYQVMWYRAHA